MAVPISAVAFGAAFGRGRGSGSLSPLSAPSGPASSAPSATTPLSLPPPPPTLPPSPSSPSSRFHPVSAASAAPALHRLPVQRPTISTALALQHASHLQPHTPLSATTRSTPFSPYARSSFPSAVSTAPSSLSSPLSQHSPAGHMAAYNPQEWSRSRPVNGSYMPHISPQPQQMPFFGQHHQQAVQARPQELTGLEASLPSPPPPYSPAGQPQPLVSPTVSASHTYPASSPVVVRPSPFSSPGASSSRGPAFPPPPPTSTRDRSGSRTRDRSIFSLSALTGRNRVAEQQQAANAIDTLNHQTTEALSRTPGQSSQASSSTSNQYYVSPIPYREYQPSLDVQSRAPAARRAASTGAIGLSSVRSPSEESQPQWTQGAALPPPPPGPPPPSSTRSASMSRTSDYAPAVAGPSTAAPAPRRHLQHTNTLGPVPPTPADWVDTDAQNRVHTPAALGLRLDTTVQESQFTSDPSIREPQTAIQSSPGLSRTHARRDPSARGIRERRSESRAARGRFSEIQSAIETSNNPWARELENEYQVPADLVIFGSNTQVPILQSPPRNNGKAVATPISSRTTRTGSGDSLQQPNTPLNRSTSEARAARNILHESVTAYSPDDYAQTPPFSPGSERIGNDTPSYIHPRALPTPPPNSALGPKELHQSSLSLPTPQSADRPVSHILHVPNEDGSMPAPLSPIRTPSAGLHTPAKQTKTTELSASYTPDNQRTPTHRPTTNGTDSFVQSCIDRHQSFIANEMAAQTDQEKLELFADFIVTESRIRRDRYSSAFDSMASDILDLTRDMWRSYNIPTGKRSVTPNTGKAASDWRSTTDTDTHVTMSSPASSVGGNFTPHTEPDSPASVKSQPRISCDTRIRTGYQPCLSPIPSMAMSTIPDEEDSRGRSASRWWEESAKGSIGRGGNKIERSARESKYMGVPREAREALQFDERSFNHSPTPDQQHMVYAANEYPVEKTGWHEPDFSVSARSVDLNTTYTHSAPQTPDPYKLDVSRLVTLPPPYPRHYPAVNNNHPDLSSIRASLRALGELDDAMATKTRYNESLAAQREQDRNDANDRRNRLRIQIQEGFNAGTVSYADAANAEADLEAREKVRQQERAKANFDGYGASVMGPLHSVFTERVKKATVSIETLREGLFDDTRQTGPNEPQEEGDEQPELLEKLNLLKWLFEMREQLHRELYSLEDERNNMYKHVILTPYLQTGNMDKVKEAENFFSQDAQERKLTSEKEVLQRYEEFLRVIEENVTRAVEMQLSAFWDIAPGLLAIVQKIPGDLDTSNVLIPPQELEENPSYHEFPLQYLFTLLLHTGKSTYQFIESQTNLLCLLHEVKTGVMIAGSRLLETQRYLAGEDYASVDAEMKGVRQAEEARLTEDLKEKVGLVEGQWEEALGRVLDDCKTHVQEYLVMQNGWDEGLLE